MSPKLNRLAGFVSFYRLKASFSISKLLVFGDLLEFLGSVTYSIEFAVTFLKGELFLISVLCPLDSV
jgi:hypothetical protein